MRADAAPDTQALRGWQRRALVQVSVGANRGISWPSRPPARARRRSPCASPPSCCADGTVERITVVVPTEHLKIQWALAAARLGIALDPKFSNSDAQTSSDYHGVVVTYAQVASHPTRHRVRTENRRTLVIFDEIHHGGDAKSWGDAIREAFDDATRRLALTGTPFRSDDSAIPFVTYEPDGDGLMRSQGRPHLRLLRRARRRRRAAGGVPGLLRRGAVARQRRRGTRGPPRRAADRRADRPGVAHRAEPGGRVDARGDRRRRHPAARAARARARRRRHDHRLRPDRRPRVRRPADHDHRRGAHGGALRRPGLLGPHLASSPPAPAAWLVAVRMVSEGVDVPRLAVGRLRHQRVDAAVLRAGDRPLRAVPPARRDREHLPAVGAQAAADWPARWRRSATTCSASRTARRSTTTLDAELAEQQQRRARATMDNGFEYARRRRRTRSGDLRRLVVRHRDARGQRRGGRLPRHPRPARRRRRCETCCGAGRKSSCRSAPRRARCRGCRRTGSCASCARELNTLVSIAHHRTGKPHGWIHNELRRICGGPPIAAATTDQLQARIEAVRGAARA